MTITPIDALRGHPMAEQWTQALGDFALWLTGASMSADTIKLRCYWLRRLAAEHPDGPWGITLDDLARFIGGRPDWSPETRKAGRAAVRSFYMWAWTAGRVETNPAAKLPIIRVPRTLPRPTPDAAVSRALATAEPRERLLVLLAAYQGLRIGEIARLHTRDITDGWLRVNGKGGKIRRVPLHQVVARTLRTVDEFDGWLFPGQIDGHLSPAHVGKLISSVLGPEWSAHTLRHRFATNAYAAERDLLAVQQLLGHAKPETTTRYTQIPSGALQRAVSAVA